MNLFSRLFRRPADPVTMPLHHLPPASPPPPRDDLAHLQKIEQVLAQRCANRGGAWREEMLGVLSKVRLKIGEMKATRK